MRGFNAYATEDICCSASGAGAFPGGCSSEVAECWVAGTYYPTKTCTVSRNATQCAQNWGQVGEVVSEYMECLFMGKPHRKCWSETKYALVCHFTQAEVCPLASSSHTRHTSVPCIPMRSGPVRTIAVPPAPHSPGAATRWPPAGQLPNGTRSRHAHRPTISRSASGAGAPTRPKWSVAAWATLSLGAALPEAGGTPSVP